MNIYVFKTSVRKKDIHLVELLLCSLIPKSNWNFDFEDRDNILRVESVENVTAMISTNLKLGGFHCEELE